MELKNTHMENGLPRRSFLRGAVITAAGLMVVPRHVLGGKGFVAPSDTVTLGLVGAGGRSLGILRELFAQTDARVIAVADPAEYWGKEGFYKTETGRGPVKKVIEEHFSKTVPGHKVTTYSDFREMLDREKSLDGIICASPDNTHAYISITSMRAGKHVYCEKPLTHNIWEARKVRDVARETGLATQMGNQLHSLDGLRQTVEYLQAGVIGKIKEIHAWVPATRWIPELSGFPEGQSPLPVGFDWNLWVGPSEWRPYHESYSPVRWRDFWTFGCGALGDFGCHDMDSAVWAYHLHSPESVEVQPAGNKGNRDIAPYGEIGYYVFPASGDQPAVNMTWYSGGLKPRIPGSLPRETALSSRGAMFVGEKGIILSKTGEAPQIFPESLKNGITPPEPTIPRSKGHCREWTDAIKGGPAPMSNFEYASRLTEITLLGVLSLRMGGQKIYWDSANMKATGIPEADQFIREPVRKGWEMT